MEMRQALQTLSALAHEGRLEVFRVLARVAPGGLPAGRLAKELGLPASTLSFHLRQLEQAELVHAQREGRVLRYHLCTETVQELFWFLGEDCCQGRVELCPPPTFRIQSALEAAPAESRPGNVLFVCSRNSARSQMAEAILRHLCGDRFDARSAGIRASEVHPLTTRVLAERGIQDEALVAEDLGDYLGKGPIDTAIVVCQLAHDQCARIYPFARQLLFWPFEDPVAPEAEESAQLDRFRRTRDEIWHRVEAWLADSPEDHEVQGA